MSPLAFVIRAVPVYLLALALTGVGASVLGPWVPSTWGMPLAILALFEFAALLTFRRERWGWAVLLAFALTAGALLQVMLTPWRPDWGLALAASVAWPSIVIPLGWKTGAGLRKLGWVTWAAAWVYILSWIAFQLIVQRPLARAAWGAAGLMIFSALTLTWSAALPTRQSSGPASAIGAEIYLIGMNLSLAATMLLRS
jgi:hypothetical protein